MKDISYKYFGFAIERPDASGNGSYSHILKMINNSSMITSLSPYKVTSHGNVKAENFRYPWDRTFEMVCDVLVEGHITGIIGVINDDRQIGINDYLFAKRIIENTYSPDNGESTRADTDSNGIIDQKDTANIKDMYLNK